MTNLAKVNEHDFMPIMSIEDSMRRYQTLVQFTSELMQEDRDYGVIPGTGNTKTLLKPGAEKLCTLFGLTTRFEIIEETEDWTGADHGGEPFFYYKFVCRLYRGDLLVGEGYGSCNSWEKKYRWRWVPEHEIPSHLNPDNLEKQVGSEVEYDFAIDKAQTSGQYGKPQEYWDKWRKAIQSGEAEKTTQKARSGKVLDAWEMDTTVYRIPNPDIHSQANTILKMSKKRSLIDATLTAVNASEFFTQDLEDIADTIDGDFRPVERQGEQAQSTQPPQQNGNKRQAPAQNGNGQMNYGQFLKAAIAIEVDGEQYYDGKSHIHNTLHSKLNWPEFDHTTYEPKHANEMLRALEIYAETGNAQAATEIAEDEDMRTRGAKEAAALDAEADNE